MMMLPAPERGPLTPAERWIAVGFLTVVLGLFSLEVALDYAPVKLTALFIVLFWVPLLILHEAGHAMVAALLGWHVGRVVIGLGYIVGRFHVGRTVVELRLLPLEGFVQPVPTNLRAPHLKSALIYFAGPGVELLFVVVMVVGLGTQTMLTHSDTLGILAAQSAAVAALLGVFVNLFPHQAMTSRGPVDNDGMGIIRSFLLPESHFAARIGLRYNEADDSWEHRDAADWWKS